MVPVVTGALGAAAPNLHRFILQSSVLFCFTESQSVGSVISLVFFVLCSYLLFFRMTVLLLCSHGDSIVFVFSSSLRVSGLSPFMGDNDNETLSNVTSATWDFEDEAFDEISDNAKDFITNLLKKDMK